MVQAVASVNRNTVVVVNTAGAIVVEPWINHPNGQCQWISNGSNCLLVVILAFSYCVSLVWSSRTRSWLVSSLILSMIDAIDSSIRIGNSVTDVLYGAYNPRLVYTDWETCEH